MKIFKALALFLFALDCKAQFIIQGKIITNYGVEVANATAYLIQGVDTLYTVQSDNNGIYTFNNVPSGSNYKISIYKKSPFSEFLNTNDYSRLQNHIVNGDELLSYEFIAADMNGSKNLNVGDLLNMYVLLTAELDENAIISWKFIPESFPMPQMPNGVSFPTFILIPDLSSDQLDLNFIGVRMGNLTPNDDIIVDSTGPKIVLVQKTSGNQPHLVEMQWWGYNFENIESFQLQINWDAELLDSVSFTNGTLIGFDMEANKIKKKEPKGHSTFVWFRSSGAAFNPDSVLIADLVFDEKCIAESTQTTVFFSDTIFQAKSAALYEALKKVSNASLEGSQFILEPSVLATGDVEPVIGPPLGILIIHISELSSGNPPFTYSWSNGIVTTDSTIIVSAGEYYCTVTDSLGCEFVMGPLIFSGSGVTESLNSTIKILPNPNAGHFVIDFDEGEEAIEDICIVDMYGNFIAVERTWFAPIQVATLSHRLPPGVYSLVLRLQSATKSIPLVIIP